MCPYCGTELEQHDEFGFFNQKYHGHFVKSGDILKCPKSDNVEEDEICESAIFNGYFHVRTNSSELQEGYPC